jgi:hypothetical protein
MRLKFGTGECKAKSNRSAVPVFMGGFMSDLYQQLYNEFGQETVHRKRRELTAQSGAVPSYIQLYSALAIDAGPPPTPPIEVQKPDMPPCKSAQDAV